MPMPPELIVFSIQSIARLAHVTNDAFEQWARDAKAVFPLIDRTDPDSTDLVTKYFNDHADLVSKPPLNEFWEVTSPRRDQSGQFDANAVDALYSAMLREMARRGIADPAPLQAGVILVEQWTDEQRPVSPWARVLVTAGGIALDYVSVNPAILGGDGNGEKLIRAYAENLSALLPADGNFGAQHDFAERLAGLFLRAGLSTLGEHPQWVVSKDHIQQLISASVSPLLEAFPPDTDITARIRWREVADTLMGPAASAALRTIAEHQGNFLGDQFATDQALGALAQVIFRQAAEQGIDDAFTNDGLVALYQAAARAAAENPKLFVNDGGEPEDLLIQALFEGLATVVAGATPPFDKALATALAAVAVEAVGANAHRFADEKNDWQQAAAEGVTLVMTQLGTALTSNQGLQSVLSRALLVDFGRIAFTRIAATPQLVTGVSETWNGVLKAVATAMAADDQLLLTGDDWREILTVACDAAVTNPGRLFRLDQNSVLAGDLLALVLRAAGDAVQQTDTRATTVLFGATLREALTLLLVASSERTEVAAARLAEIEGLVRGINDLVSNNAQRFGSQAWLTLFSMLLNGLLRGEPVPNLDIQTAESLLAEVA